MSARKSRSSQKKAGKKAVKKSVSKKTTTKKWVVKKSAVKKAAVKKSPTKKRITKKVASKKPVKKISKASTKGKSKGPINKVVLKVGDVAPAFSRLNQDGKAVHLDDFAGRKNVVLYFYPRAMTPGCTVQACGIRDSAADFESVNAVVLGVSPDKVASLVKFRVRDKLNFDLLSDEDKTLAKTYGVWGLKQFMGREFMGVRRWTFIIGKDGIIKHVMDDVNTKKHHDDVLAILKTL